MTRCRLVCVAARSTRTEASTDFYILDSVQFFLLQVRESSVVLPTEAAASSASHRLGGTTAARDARAAAAAAAQARALPAAGSAQDRSVVDIAVAFERPTDASTAAAEAALTALGAIDAPAAAPTAALAAIDAPAAAPTAALGAIDAPAAAPTAALGAIDAPAAAPTAALGATDALTAALGATDAPAAGARSCPRDEGNPPQGVREGFRPPAVSYTHLTLPTTPYV